MANSTCSRKGCRSYVYYRGLCNSHLRATGAPVPSPFDRIMDRVRVNKDSGCWEWQGRLSTQGYGRIDVGQKGWQVHRLTYIDQKGPIPEGLEIDHLCRNRKCCNPDHLEAVTDWENWWRGEAPSAIAHKTGRCFSGRHELSGENLYVYPNGVRRCRACQKEVSDAAREEKRLAKIAAGESRGRQVDRTHCPQGHAYDEENTYMQKKGGRSCRACQRESARRYNERKRAEREAAGLVRVRAAERTECANGHPYTAETTYFHPDGRRFCRPCQNEAYKRYYQKNKAKRQAAKQASA